MYTLYSEHIHFSRSTFYQRNLKLAKSLICIQVNEEELIYIDVSHDSVHPPDAPPICSEEATIYAALDMQQMAALKNVRDQNASKVDNQSKPEYETSTDQSVYENFTVEAEHDFTQ